LYGFPAAQEPYVGSEKQRTRLRRSYEKKKEWMKERGLCVWNGEWGPVYARKLYDGEAADSINEQRYNVLKDQLAIYNEVCLSCLPWACHLIPFSHTGLPQLVYLDIQRYWFPRDGLRIP
jgi:hypothetical protein